MPENIGLRIKKQRKQQGLSLRDLAKRTGLTASFLSQVERGKTNASIDSLRRIAEALEVSMLHFLSDDSDRQSRISASVSFGNLTGSTGTPPVTNSQPLAQYNPVVRSDARPKLILPDSGVTYELLTPDLAHKMEVIRGQLAPGADNVARPLREPTEEWIYVLHGALRVELEHGVYVLNSGDTIYFEGRSLRRLTCASEQEVTWISVITPPVF